MRVDGPGTASMTHRTRTVKVRKALTSAEHRVVLIIRTLAIQQKNSAAGDVATDRAMPKAPQRLTLRENAAARGFLTDMAHGIIDGGTAVATCLTGTGSTRSNACGAKATPVPHVNR